MQATRWAVFAEFCACIRMYYAKMNNETIDHEAREMAQRALDRLVQHERQCSLMWRGVAATLLLMLISYTLTHLA